MTILRSLLLVALVGVASSAPAGANDLPIIASADDCFPGAKDAFQSQLSANALQSREATLAQTAETLWNSLPQPFRSAAGDSAHELREAYRRLDGIPLSEQVRAEFLVELTATYTEQRLEVLCASLPSARREVAVSLFSSVLLSSYASAIGMREETSVHRRIAQYDIGNVSAAPWLLIAYSLLKTNQPEMELDVFRDWNDPL